MGLEDAVHPQYVQPSPPAVASVAAVASGGDSMSPLSSPLSDMDEAATDPGKEVRTSGVAFYDRVFGIAMLVSIVVGASFGIILRFLFKERWSQRHVMYLAFPGELLSLMLRETALPLSASSVIAAAGSMERPLAWRVARHALAYVLLVKAASQGCALLATFTVQPGRAVEPGDVQRLLEAVPHEARLVHPAPPRNGTADAFSDMARSLFPENIVEAFINTDTPEVLSFSNNTSAHRSPHRLVAHQAGVLFFCAMLGAVLSSDRCSALLGFTVGLSNAMMLFAHLVLVYAPFGVFFTTAAYFVQQRNLQLMASHLGLYLFTVVLALGTHALLVLPLTAMAGTRRSFRALICHGALPLLLSLSTGSGRNTVPATVVALEERLHLDPKIVRLLVPALAVVAVDGTSICVTVGALFFGHMRTDTIELLTVLCVCLLSMLCSMATSTGVRPGYLRLRLIQETVGMPTEYVGILFVSDWFVDRLASVVDVLTGVVGVQVVQHYSGVELRPRGDAEEHPPTDDVTKEPGQ